MIAAWDGAEMARRRAGVLARYGSEEASLAPCKRERALSDALRLSRDPANPRWTAGEHAALLVGDLPESIRKAAAGAYAMPTTMAEAFEELTHWHEREREMLACLGAAFVGQSLDIVAEIRRKIISEMRLCSESEDVAAALRADPGQPDRAIARRFGRSPSTVGAVRRKLGLLASKRSVTRGGVEYQMEI